MKKLHLLFVIFALYMGFNSLNAQNIDILESNNTPLNTIGICQCDTTKQPNIGIGRIDYQLLIPFASTTTFTYELGPNNDFTNPIPLSLVGLFATATGSVAASPFTSGNVKFAELAIPCNAPLGPSAIRITNSNGEVSNIIYFIINRIPAKPVIKNVFGGFPNPYTLSNDWGFCTGDSVKLEVDQQLGGSYQWLNNGIPIVGETDTILKVTSGGVYSVRVTLGGGCSLESKDTLINPFLPPTAVTFVGGPPAAYQIDNPSIGNVTPFDSVQFCEDQSFPFRANSPPATTTLTFKYTWLTDSITQFGTQVFYQTRPGDTNQFITIDSSLIETFPQKFYVAINDGFCTDTSEAYIVYMDTMPRTTVLARNYSQGNPGPRLPGDVCMRDSTLLESENIIPGWRYQWQRLNTSAVPAPIWENLPNGLNPNVNGTGPTLQVDTSLKPINSLSYYRLVTTTVTPFNEIVVCTFVSDSIRIRWYPEDSIMVLPGQPQANIVGLDQVNICEVDSVILRAPGSPNSFTLPYTYQWLTDSIGLGGGRIIYPTGTGDTLRNFTAFDEGRYYVIINDGICVDTIRPYRVFVDSLPSTALVPAGGFDLNLCFYDSTIITATDTIIPFWDYQWEQFIEGTGWVTLANDTNPAITVDSSDIVNNDTLYFRLNTEYVNQFGLAICPFVSDSIMVVFYESPIVTIFPDDTIGLCFEDSVFVVAEGDGFSYQWLDLGTRGASRWITSTGTYVVQSTGVNGCITEHELFVFDLQITGSASGDQTIQSGEIATLTATGGTSYRWFADKPLDFNDFLSETIKVSKTLDDDVSSDTIKVYVLITNGDGCRKLDSLQLIILNKNAEDIILLQNTYNLFTPNADGLNDIWDISRVTKGKVCEIMMMNRWGSVIFEDKTEWDGTWDGNDSGGNPLPDGTYYYVLSCNKEVILKSAVTLIRNE